VDIKRFLGEANEYTIDSSHPLIELDPNKCVLCGRCVRVCSDVVGVAAYGYINRGFGTVVMPAFGQSLLDTECVTCGLCIGTCPTGAIAQKIPLAKPGPWKTRSVPSVCHYCGVGCQIDYDVFGDTLVKVSRNETSAVTFGNHCRKGRFGFNYVQSPERLRKGRIRPGREMQDASPDDAIGYAAMRLKEIGRRYNAREIAVFVSPRLTNEEIYLAQKFARVALKTHNVTSFTRLVNQEVSSPGVLATANYSDVIDAQTILVVNGNPADEHFVVDLLAKRAIRNGGKLIYVGPEENRTSQFAEIFLQSKPEAEGLVLLAILAAFEEETGKRADQRPAGLDEMAKLTPADVEARTGVDHRSIREAARLLKQSILKVLIFNRDHRGSRRGGEARLFVAAGAALGCSILPLNEKANAQGLLDMGADPRWYPGYLAVDNEEAIEDLEKEWCVALRDLDTAPVDVAEMLREKKIKVAIVLGEDPLGSDSIPEDLRAGLLATDFLVVGDLFMTETARAANVVLPLASSVETSGTFTNSERRVQRVRRAIPAAAGIETWEIICQLAARMGFRFKMRYAGPGEVMEEIRRVAPIYRDVVVDSQEADAIWDLGRFPLPAQAWDGDLGPSVEPIRTLSLDHLEVRFEKWFDRLFPRVETTQDGVAETGSES
jgi:predicted molibdopterin-dependent oxidoreductase YjgC